MSFLKIVCKIESICHSVLDFIAKLTHKTFLVLLGLDELDEGLCWPKPKTGWPAIIHDLIIIAWIVGSIIIFVQNGITNGDSWCIVLAGIGILMFLHMAIFLLLVLIYAIIYLPFYIIRDICKSLKKILEK